MWHEARKQEKKIRGLLVDYRKRAERRNDFYERIKADPTQFMQIHGRKSKIYLDPSIALAAENQAIMMPWQGQKDNLIDRFDVRAHLDYIPPAVKADSQEEDLCVEERQINYERYRILAQNEFLAINEEKFLFQLALEEQFGVNAQVEAELKASSSSKKKSGNVGVAIGYTYEENEAQTIPFSQTISTIETSAANTKYEECMKDESDSDLDMDVSIDINKVKNDQAHEMNAAGRHYGMKSNDFYSFLTKDADEADALRLAREEEQEKIMFSGRKSRRERRAQRERRFAGRPLSPPSYAAKEELVPRVLAENDSSRSPSPDNSGKITYITSFGGEDELQLQHSKITINLSNKGNNQGTSSRQMSYAEKVKENLDKLKAISHQDTDRKPAQYKRYSSSRSRSRSRHRLRGRNNFRDRRRRSVSRSRRRRYKSYSRSRSRSSSYSSKSPRKRTRTRRSLSKSSSSSSSSSSRSRNLLKRRTYSTESSVSPQKKAKDVLPLVPPVVEKLATEEVSLSLTLPPPVIKEEPMETDTSPVEVPSIIQPEPEVPIKRYYGRKREDETSSDGASDEEADKNPKTIKPEIMDTSSNSCPATEFQIKPEKLDIEFSSRFGKTSTQLTSDTKTSVGGTGSSSTKLATFNPRDRLKRKMQILLNKQYKADKKAEIEKTERQIQMQQEREDEMRELALKLRRRQRELRHKYGTPESNKSPSKDSSGSSDGDEEQEEEQEEEVKKVVIPPKEIKKKEQPQASASTVPKSLINQGIVIERKPVLRRFAERSRSRSKSRIKRISRSKSRSRKRSVSRGRDYRQRGYYDRSRRSRERHRSRSRDRHRRTDYKRRSRSRRRTRTRSRDRKDRDRKREESPKNIRKLVDY